MTSIFRHSLLLAISLSVLLAAPPSVALQGDVRGQLSGWVNARHQEEEWNYQVGIRYLPQFTVEQMLTDVAFADVDVALNGFTYYDSLTDEEEADLDVYRLKLRLATAQTETRLGLQRINFGPAQLLRSLKWFDQLDPRDPLQLTDGVYALRFKYNALNNANLWLWGLYGNDDLKGYEQFASVEDEPEVGGRLQYPVLNGELAATAHTRMADAPPPLSADFRETRVALDGRWEKGVGFWFEAVSQYQDEERLPYQWMNMLTLGSDYTIDRGNGLYVVAEHLASAASEEAAGWDEDRHVSALSLSYPLGLLDSLRGISYYDWEREKFSLYLSWQRMYDRWQLDVSVFHYPEADSNAVDGNQQLSGSGSGGQFMLIYYH